MDRLFTYIHDSLIGHNTARPYAWQSAEYEL